MFATVLKLGRNPQSLCSVGNIFERIYTYPPCPTYSVQLLNIEGQFFI